MTYQDLVNVKLNCQKSIELLYDAINSAEKAYVAENFDNSLMGYPVEIHNELYPRTSCRGRYIITKVMPHGEKTFDLSIVPINKKNEKCGMDYTIYGIGIDDIKKVSD